MLKIYAKPGVAVSLGFQGERDARQILFDISSWQQVYGEGRGELIAQRCGDEAPYPIVTERQDKYLAWTVSDADTGVSGIGKCELRYYTGDTLAKSETWTTVVCASLGQETEPPAAQQGWVDAVLRAAETVEDTMMTAEQAVITAEEAVATAKQASEDVKQAAETVAQTAETVEQAILTTEQAAASAEGSAAAAEQKVAAAEEAVIAAQQNASDAKAAAATAEQEAIAAEEAALTAGQNAETAQAAAAAAGQNAAAAQQYVSDAQQAAVAAGEQSAAAGEAAATAAQSAATAETAAAAAGEKATAAENAAESAKQAMQQGPVIGENGNWLLWDAEMGAYADSGVAAAGRDIKELPEITDDDIGKMLVAGEGKTPVWGYASASSGIVAEIHVTAVSGTTVTCQMGSTVLTAEEQGGLWIFYPEAYGNWTVKGSRDVYASEAVVEVTASKIYTVELIEEQVSGVYGVSWDRSASTRLSRTDCAALFTDPVPAYGTGAGSSPFDSLMPWAGMAPVTIDGNAMVRIPKFWFRWTDAAESLMLQISDHELEGFHVSPMHADRGDGKGERDYAYIGRYKVMNNRYQTVAGYIPFNPTSTSTGDFSRTGFRDGIHTYQSEGFHMQDWAAFWTVRMLYLVEFADWNAQSVIGPGILEGTLFQLNGDTAAMSYHTGSVDTGAVSYRYIENLWSNGLEFVDGIRKESRTIYINNNPAYSRAYPDDPGTVALGFQTVNGGNTTSFYVPTEAGCEYALFPDAVLGSAVSSNDEYISDYFGYNAAGTEVIVGGNTALNATFGMFYITAVMCETTAEGTVNDGYMTTRVMYLP